MKSFSQRQGIKPIKDVIQVNAMDKELRNRLWDALDIFYWQDARPYELMESPYNREYYTLAKRLWHNYFKEPIDTITGSWYATWEILRKYYFSCEWNEVYDFIEFIANNFEVERKNEEFIVFCNQILESELSGYRFVGTTISPITSEQEITEVEEALDSTKPVASHLQTALDLLSNRESPDYRNSIKESISAVEAICALIAGDKDATLGDALSIIKRKGKVDLHPALRGAFDKLYGYTSDAEGIRHALLDEPGLHFEDAKFMLVSCSAFVNYLKMKAAKAGINL